VSDTCTVRVLEHSNSLDYFTPPNFVPSYFDHHSPLRYLAIPCEALRHYHNHHLSIPLITRSIRLPVGWQYLVGSTTDSSSTTLDATFFATYNNVTSVTDSGAYAIIDVHNYARWNGEIIGQGGPSNDDVSAEWGPVPDLDRFDAPLRNALCTVS
jgi:hypothetical protein